jgi:hypothetical protein
MRFGIFLTVVTPPVIAFHGYLWHRAFRATGAPRRAQIAGAAACGALAACFLLAALRPAWMGPELKAAVCAVGFPWIGFAIFLAAALAFFELPRAWARRRAHAVDPARRRTLERVLGGAAVVAAGGASLAGAAEALALTVQRVRVPLRRLPASLSGLRIVQVSDLHLGVAVGPAYFDRVLELVRSLKPDLVAITGDLVDGTVATLGPMLQKLAEVPAAHGVYFVTGNHEYYADADAWAAYLGSLGVRVLRNERVSIGGPDGSFDLAGVEDLGASDATRGRRRHDLPAALAGRDPARELVLLAHQPASVLEAARHGVGLTLSGHTHGGQIWPIRFLIYLDQPFVDGLHRVRDTWIYVSRGAGYWGPPMRVGAPPEVAEITLVREG